MRRLSSSWRRGFVAGLALLGGLVLALWLTPSSQYLLLPDKAQPVDPLVKIADEGEDGEGDGDGEAAGGAAGIYMVDILVRKANLLERIFPGLKEGASLVPGSILNPEGVSEEQRRQSSRLDMTRSHQIAAAVALESLGYEVEVEASGAEVSLVTPDSPAAEAGLRPGDLIVEAAGRRVRTTADLRGALAGVEPGESVRIAVRRSGGVREYTLATRAAENDPDRAVIGVRVQQGTSIDLPIEIEIDTGSVGGPSAGLAFALDIVDELGRDVDQGRRIVVTGELTIDGRVEPIGGVKQKVIAAMQAGADIFVVPLGNAREAERYAEDIAIVPVATFAEALSDLAWRSGGPPPIEEAAA